MKDNIERWRSNPSLQGCVNAAGTLQTILAAWQDLRTKTVITESALFAELKRAIEGEG